MSVEVKNCSQINKIANGERLFSRLEASEFLGFQKVPWKSGLAPNAIR